MPFFIAGRAGGALRGEQHLKAPDGTPLSNVLLGLLHRLGLDEVKEFGDSDEAFSLDRVVGALIPWIKSVATKFTKHEVDNGQKATEIKKSLWAFVFSDFAVFVSSWPRS